MEVVSKTEDKEILHVVYSLKFNNMKNYKRNSRPSIKEKSTKCQEICPEIKSSTFFKLFPFHVIFNRQLVIVSLGQSLKQCLGEVTNQERLQDFFNLNFPSIPFTWENVV